MTQNANIDLEQRLSKARCVRDNLEPKLIAYMDGLGMGDGDYPRNSLDRFHCAAALLCYLRGDFGNAPFSDTFLGQWAVPDEILDKLSDPDFTPIPAIERQCDLFPGDGFEWGHSLRNGDEIWFSLVRG